MGKLGTQQLGTQQLGSATVSTTNSDPVEAIVDILSGFSAWTLSAPSVEPRWKRAQQERENEPNPYIYVWGPAEGSLDARDADVSAYDNREIIEAQIWVLNDAQGTPASDCKTYHSDMIDILDDYSNDNEQKTQFHYIRPDAEIDNRQENIVRRTDHFIMSLQVEVHTHRDT